MKCPRGQVSSEYLGVLLVVSVIIAAVASTGLGGQLVRALEHQVCAIAQGGPTGCGAKPERRGAASRRPSRVQPPVVAVAANVPCDDMTPRECTALRALINRMRAEHERARDQYIHFAVQFASWVAGIERITNIRTVVLRPGLINAVNRYLRKDLNREGARLLTSVRNRPLENLIVSNYRYGARVGNGSSAAKLREEVATGVPWGAPGSHYIKAVESISRLNKILRRERLTARERQIATNIRQELWEALPPHRRPKLR